MRLALCSAVLAASLLGCKGDGGDLPRAACGANHAAGWQSWTELPESLESAAVAVGGEQLWVAGGYDFETWARDEVVSLDLSEAAAGTGSWQSHRSLPEPTEHQAAVWTTGGTLLLMGGDQDYGSTVRDVVWVGTPDEDGLIDGWLEAEPLPEARTLHAVAVRRGDWTDDVYLIGGTWDFATGMVFSDKVWHSKVDADGLPGEWTEQTTLPDRRGWAAAAVRNGELVVSGGISRWGPEVSEDTVWSAPLDEDGQVGSWTALEALPSPRHRHSLTKVGSVLHAVGGDSEEGELDEVLILTDDGTWGAGQPLPEPRFSHTAVEAEDELVVVGGFYEFRDTRADVWAIPGCGT